MARFLKSLIIVSEKAANIARVCRSEKELFSLLVEEKKGEEGNTARFFQDFKTLADVLVQETVRHDIAEQFPHLANSIKGEESNMFSNTLNTTIKIEVKDEFNETANLLVNVLDGDNRAAELLAAEVHRNIDFDSINSDFKDIPDDFEIDLENIGIWIDPIDSTTEYISGQTSTENENELHKNGLQCVTVLIGAFDKTTGYPCAGVINQPFYKQIDNNKWQGKCYWGIQAEHINLTSQQLSKTLTNKIVISGLETSDVQERLIHNNFEILKAAGAGYKILTVLCGITDAYILSQDTIYKWDTCGPHAILKTLGGSIIEYKSALKGNLKELRYDDEFDTETKNIKIWRHAEGIIAYRSLDTLAKIINTLAKLS